MIYWDSSAIIPLCIQEPHSHTVRKIARQDPLIVTWWASRIECRSSFARLRRDKIITLEEENRLFQLMGMLAQSWTEILPGEEVRAIAMRLLLAHPLRAADSLQLASALFWSDKLPRDHAFVCLNTRLRDAAYKEGFRVLPE